MNLRYFLSYPLAPEQGCWRVNCGKVFHTLWDGFSPLTGDIQWQTIDAVDLFIV